MYVLYMIGFLHTIQRGYGQCYVNPPTHTHTDCCLHLIFSILCVCVCVSLFKACKSCVCSRGDTLSACAWRLQSVTYCTFHVSSCRTSVRLPYLLCIVIILSERWAYMARGVRRSSRNGHVCNMGQVVILSCRRNMVAPKSTCIQPASYHLMISYYLVF